MRIISSFRDYYDSGQSAGQDQETVYLRNPEEISYRGLGRGRHAYPFPFLPDPRKHWGEELRLEVREYVIGFCGKLYPLLLACAVKRCHRHIDLHDSRGRRRPRPRKFTAPEVAQYQVPKKKGHWRLERHWSYWQRRFQFVEYFEACAGAKNPWPDCPVFIADRCRELVTLNGSLKDVGFFRRFGTLEAFQELAMFVGNQARPSRPIPPVSDADMAAAKGFDKYSFRKDPSRRE